MLNNKFWNVSSTIFGNLFSRFFCSKKHAAIFVQRNCTSLENAVIKMLETEVVVIWCTFSRLTERIFDGEPFDFDDFYDLGVFPGCFFLFVLGFSRRAISLFNGNRMWLLWFGSQRSKIPIKL